MLKILKTSKISSLLLLLIFISGNLYAQTCDDYIPNNWHDSRYTDNGNGTVTDKKTNLMWKKCSEGQSGSNCGTGTATTYNWQAALQHANTHTFVGKSDWRLPNIKELKSLVAFNCHNPSINLSVFPKTPAGYFWSASPNASFPVSTAWLLNFGNGDSNIYTLDISSRVRLVRFGQ